MASKIRQAGQAILDLFKIRLAKLTLSHSRKKSTNLLHKAKGKLVFRDSGKPLHNMEVELWDRDLGAKGDYLGKSRTDKNGSFEIAYDPQDAGLLDTPDLELRVFEERAAFNASNEIVISRRLAYTIKGQDNVKAAEYDFGTASVPYWAYNPSQPFPRLMLVQVEESPDPYSVGRSLQGYEVGEMYQQIKTKHAIANTLNSSQPDLKTIQANYPDNLTVKLEKERPGYTRSDEYLVWRALNGMNPCLLQQHKRDRQKYRAIFNWDAYEKNANHDLHNVEAIFSLEAEQLQLQSITIHSRYPDSLPAFSPLQDPVTCTPQDGEKWQQAKRIFRTNYLFGAELIEHYIKSHLQMEQYAIAAFRNLRQNPLRLMLLPHLKSLVNINLRADAILVSDSGYVTSAGPLSVKGAVKVCQDYMGWLNWQNWQPRPALTAAHQYAQAANLYWQLLGEYIDTFFQKYQQDIAANWAEIRALSDDLVEHSVAYQPPAPIVGAEDWEWYDAGEIDKSNTPRVQIKGSLKAVSPITLADLPGNEDLANLKQFCRYVIFHLTFWHSWVNDRQADDGGEFFYSSLALRNGSFGSEDDLNIAPDPMEATQLLFLVHSLSEIKYGYILKNEDSDIPRELRDLLLKNKHKFAALDFDISQVRSLINI